MTLGFAIGDWCWHARQSSPCRVVDRQDIWGETAYGVWLPAKDAVVRAEARYQAIGRIGLPAVRAHRRKRLEAEHAARMTALADAEACTPALNAVLMLRIGHAGGAPA